MGKVIIDMRPEPFELPFKHEKLDQLEKNRLKLWQEKGRTLGEGSVFASGEYGMERDSESGEMTVWPSNRTLLSKYLPSHLNQAKDFIEYHERHADEHGGLNVGECHEWGNAKQYDGGDIQPRSLLYGVRLTFNDGTQLFYRIESKRIEEL